MKILDKDNIETIQFGETVMVRDPKTEQLVECEFKEGLANMVYLTTKDSRVDEYMAKHADDDLEGEHYSDYIKHLRRGFEEGSNAQAMMGRETMADLLESGDYRIA